MNDSRKTAGFTAIELMLFLMGAVAVTFFSAVLVFFIHMLIKHW